MLVHKYSPSPPPSKKKKRDDPMPLVSYDETKGEGDTDEAVSALKSLKGNEGVEQPHMSPMIYEEVHGYDAQVQEDVEPINHVDERVALSLTFIEDDEFINTTEFKYFSIKMKMKEFEEKK